VTFTCDTFPGREFNGTVGKVRLNATMTQNVVMYTVEVNTENPGGILLPYLTANVRFVVHSETNALLVPNAALRWSPSSLAQVSPEARSWKPADESAGILWLKEGEFVRPVSVKAGATDGANTVVTSDALQDGRQVVTGELVETGQTGTQNPFVPQFRKR
jgi:HlyD family secretion protein